jgi:hypothetical protein
MIAFAAAKAQRCESTRDHYDQEFREPVLAQFASRHLLDTRPDDVLQLLNEGTVSTNMYVRRLHNYALMLGWLPWPILNYRQWPSRKYKQKRDITWGEHRLLVDTEKEPEWRAFLELAWHVGAARIDLVSLCAENIDRHTKTITYFRRKTSKPCVLRFGDDVAKILRSLPASGALFPKLSELSSADRAVRFLDRVERLGNSEAQRGSRHSFRQPAFVSLRLGRNVRVRLDTPSVTRKKHFGHASAAIHRAYAKSVRVELPPLEEYEKPKVVTLPKAA